MGLCQNSQIKKEKRRSRMVAEKNNENLPRFSSSKKPFWFNLRGTDSFFFKILKKKTLS